MSIRAATAGLLLWLTAAANAQIDLGVQARQDPRQMMADQLILLVQDVLAGDGMPEAYQVMRAQVLLDLALDLAPDRVEFWRLKAQFAELRGDRDERRGAVGQIVRLDPRDDAAQLELILDSVSRQQTLDQRLAMVERVLDSPSGRTLSGPLRSRLASFAAAAAEELGDQRKFARRLAQALDLDPANGDAARMMYELAMQRGDSPLHRGTAVIGWVRSQPASSAARQLLGETLLREGLFEQAAQQFEMSVSLAQAPPTSDHLRKWVMATAMAGQTDAALSLLRDVERSLEQGGNGGERLPAELELLRLAILSISVQPETTRENFEKLAASLRPMIEAGDAAARRELAVAAAMFGHDLEAAEGYLGQANADDETRRMVRGWVALRYGRHEQGTSLLRPLAERHPPAALGVALLEQDPGVRASMLETIRARDPVGMPGLLAVLNLRRMNAPVGPTRVGQSLAEVMRKAPARLWFSDLTLSPWLAMRLSVEPGRLAYLEPVRGAVMLQNLSGVPLSVGDGGAVPGRMLVSIQPSRAGEPLPPLPPLVVDLGRRITLQPSERLTVDFRVDHSYLGELLAMNPSQPVSFQATGIVDPRPTVYGTVRPGPMGAIDSVRAIQLVHQPVNAENIRAWIAGLESPDRAEQLRSIARLLRSLSVATSAEAGGEAVRTQVAEALAQRFRNFDTLQQAWTMRFLPPVDRQPVAVQRVVELAQRSREPLVRLVYLESQVTDPASPALNAALREEDPLIGEYARALRESLRERQAARDAAAQGPAGP
jgi:tetratricopeptide (TPR) repeat protein